MNAERRGGWFFPRWLAVVLALLAGLVALIQGTDLLQDHGFANVATALLGLVVALLLFVWFCFFSRRSKPVRFGTLAVGVAAVAVAAVLFKLDHFSGEMIPTFVYRFARPSDRTIETSPPASPEESAAPVDLRTTTAQDFPGFLGPDRSASVAGIRLDRDWAARPPQLMWRHPVGAGWSAFSVVNGHAVTMEQRDDQELVTCYDVKTGRLEWTRAADGRFETTAAGLGPRATPSIDRGLVFAVGAVGRLACLNGATGRPLWEKDLLAAVASNPGEEAFAVPHGRSNSPLVAGDLVIVAGGGPKAGPHVSLLAFDRTTGARAWQSGERQIGYSSPSLARLGGVEQVLIVNEDTASGHDPRTGRLLWEHPWKGQSGGSPNVSQAVPVPPDRVFLSKGYARGAALLRLTPQADGRFAPGVVWESSKVLRTKFTNVVIRDGHLYGLSDGILECVALDTGQPVWKAGRYRHGQILRVDDLLLVLSESGQVFLVELTSERPNHVLGQFQALEGMSWNTFALAGPYLLLRNAQDAACYQLPLDEPTPHPVHSP